jgi:hypothetical protein
MHIVLERVFGVDKNIVEINIIEFVQVIEENVVHELLLYYRGISKSFLEDLIFVYSIVYTENHKLFGI